jgi:hypothetical protein
VDLTGNGDVISRVAAQVKHAAPTLTLSTPPACMGQLHCKNYAGVVFHFRGNGFSASPVNLSFQQDVSGKVTQLPNRFSAPVSNYPDAWQERITCTTTPQTVVFFAQNPNDGSSSNAVMGK